MGRNSTEIRVWLQRQGIRQADIRRELGFADPKTVWATIQGMENNRKVLAWLLKKGCPKKHLSLPADMKMAA